MSAVATDSPGIIGLVNPLDVPDWDLRLAAHPGATVFHSAGWAAVLAETYGFKPVYLVCQTGDRLQGLLALMEVRSLLGVRRGISLPFTDSVCPLLPEGETDQDLVSRFLLTPAGADASVAGRLRAGAQRLAQVRAWRSVEFRPRSPLQPQELAAVRFVNHELSLADSDERQRRLCAPAMRRSLRQAEAAALPVRIGSDLALVRSYYRLHCLTRRRQGAPPQSWRFFNSLHQRLLAPGMGFVVLVGDSPVAGAVYLRFGRRAVYKFGASDGRLLHTRPNQRVMWAGLRHAAGLGCTVMDLGRTSPGNHGLRRFKEGWGSVETQLAYRCFDLYLRCGSSLKDRTAGWQSGCFRLAPVWLARVIGRFAYRYAA